MMCPECGSENIYRSLKFGSPPGAPKIWDYCPDCGVGTNERTMIDPAELLELIEAALKYQDSGPRWGTGAFYMKKLAEPIYAYLKGDPQPLKTLAGETS